MSLLKKGFSKFQRLIFFAKKKGVRYAYNHWWYTTFYISRGFLHNLFMIKFYPFFSYPQLIEVETTTRCNLRCIMCENTYWKEKGKDMSYKDFKYIIDQFPKSKWIGVTGIGSSFLNPDFLKMLEYIKQKDKSTLIEIFDTFYNLDENICKKLIEIEVDTLIVSIDAATKETYEKIRVGSNFEKVINNIKNMIELKKGRKVYFPEISFHYIISKLNISEIIPFIDLVYSLTAGNTSILFTPLLHKFEEIKDIVIDIGDEIIMLAEKKAQKLNIKLSWNRNISHLRLPINKCTNWIMPFIFVGGEVVACCAAHEANRRDFEKENSFGNIFEKSFKEIWNEDLYKNFRYKIHRNEVPTQCKDCPIYRPKEEI